MHFQKIFKELKLRLGRRLRNNLLIGVMYSLIVDCRIKVCQMSMGYAYYVIAGRLFSCTPIHSLPNNE